MFPCGHETSSTSRRRVGTSRIGGAAGPHPNRVAAMRRPHQCL